ncbi:hypothetical protein SAMN05444360_105146 [Chryseobacterium carnipullorum]|uniref:hypothetical protein n=1 Tax=Chryseobacterium carnipullorum TaxID=1124835 RepID=UPI00090FDB6A|nr:hypothetical protein [Chryseobacterium carnipullorum]SHL87584.1 hypothetical protein SAMN05444360_105146 [Chryseobacterium carnipullorum]
MKKIFKIISLFILMLLSNKINAQIDTLNYLKQFEANKAQYIGQPFSKLLQDMTQIQPKTVWGIPVFNNITIINESRFKFCKKEHSFNNAVILEIIWHNEIPFSEIKYYQNKNQFYFTDEERLFYGSKIVKDIKVYRW